MRTRTASVLASVAFGATGLLWALAAGRWLPGWQWWLLGSLVLVVLARAALGRRIRALAFIVGALTPVVVISCFVFGYPTLDNWWHRTAFDPVVWKQGAKVDDPMWPPRLRMIDDLLKHRRLFGMTRAQVTDLLGESENHERTGHADWDMVYYLGPERGLIRIDSECLGLRFGPDGRVAEVRTLFD